MSVIALPIVLMLGVLTLVSYVERLYTEIGKFLSREFQATSTSLSSEWSPG